MKTAQITDQEKAKEIYEKYLNLCISLHGKNVISIQKVYFFANNKIGFDFEKMQSKNHKLFCILSNTFEAEKSYHFISVEQKIDLFVTAHNI